MPIVVTVGDGRGFVVEMPRRNKRLKYRQRVLITASHCLPHLPPAHPGAMYYERTYARIVGPLGTPPTVSAECYFVDPISDLAVLGQPDNQEFHEQADAYDALVEDGDPLRMGALRYDRSHKADLLALTGEWFSCCVTRPSGGSLWISDAAQDIVGGMSGSPILHNGSAVGVLCVTSGSPTSGHRGGGPNPYLWRDLPSWMLRRNY